MDRGEFLSILRESLEGCIPMEEVEKNIAYYRNYFDEAGKSERDIIEELGDPRLIARTIIDAYKASKGPMADYYTEQARNEYSREYSEQYTDGTNQAQNDYQRSGPAWYEKALGWIVIVFVLAVIFVLAVNVVGLFVGYVLPVLLVIVLLKFIINQFRK